MQILDKCKQALLVTLFLVLSLNQELYAQTANHCARYRCDRLVPVQVCFVDPGALTSPLSFQEPILRSTARRACGRDSKMHVVESQQEMQSVLEDYASKCQRITRLTFHTHASPGELSVGPIYATNVARIFSGHACLMARNSQIKITGCSAGSSCTGQILMYRLAQVLLSGGGTVMASTSATIPGYSSTIPINGKWRKLTYNPRQLPRDSWTQTGLALSNGKSVTEACRESSQKLVDEYIRLERSRHFAKCSGHLPKHQIDDLRQTLNVLNNDRLPSFQDKLEVLGPSYDGFIIDLVTESMKSLRSCIFIEGSGRLNIR